MYDFHEKGFCNMFLEECLISFKMYEDGKKYIYVLWDIGEVCIYIYIIFFFLRNVFVKYMEVWGIWRLNVVNRWAYVVAGVFLCVISWVMLLLNKRDFVRE